MAIALFTKCFENAHRKRTKMFPNFTPVIHNVSSTGENDAKLWPPWAQCAVLGLQDIVVNVQPPSFFP